MGPNIFKKIPKMALELLGLLFELLLLLLLYAFYHVITYMGARSAPYNYVINAYSRSSSSSNSSPSSSRAILAIFLKMFGPI